MYGQREPNGDVYLNLSGMQDMGLIDPLTAATAIGGGVLALANTWLGGSAASEQAKQVAKQRQLELKAAQAALAAQQQMQQLSLADAQAREAASRRNMLIVLGIGGIAIAGMVLVVRRMRR